MKGSRLKAQGSRLKAQGSRPISRKIGLFLLAFCAIIPLFPRYSISVEFFGSELRMFSERRGKDILLANALNGQRGTARVMSADRYPVNGGSAGGFLSYFSQDDFLKDGQTHSRWSGRLFVMSSPVEPMELSLNARGFSHSVDDVLREGQLIQAVGDPSLNIKFYYHPFNEFPLRILRFGLCSTAYAFSSLNKTGVDFSSTSLSGRGLLTVNLRHYIPLLIHLNAGYYWDNSDEVLRERFFLPTRTEKFAMGVDGEERYLMGIALESFVERYSFAIGFIEATSELGKETNLIRITPGIKFFMVNDLVAHLSMDYSLTPELDNEEVLPTFTLFGGLSYNLFPKD